MKKDLTREIFRILPMLAIIGAALLLYRGDYSQLIMQVYILAQVALVVIVFHCGRKSLFPYIDLRRYAEKAAESSLGAAIVFFSLIMFLFSLILVSLAKAGMTDEEILGKANVYMPLVRESLNDNWPDAPHRHYEAGKIEQETCVNLQKCWNPRVELKTAREWGFGLSQMTIAYNPDGSERFNKFAEAKAQYYKALEGWKFSDRYNPRYHIIFSVLETRANFNKVKPLFNDDLNRWAGALVAYNAGGGTVLKRRAVCLKTPGCSPDRWFGGLDSVQCTGEDKLLYGVSLKVRRDAYPRNIIFRRSQKYQRYFL